MPTQATPAISLNLDMDMDAVENDEVSLITQLCSKFNVNSDPCLPNQLIRGDESRHYPGYATYREAKARWLSGCDIS